MMQRPPDGMSSLSRTICLWGDTTGLQTHGSRWRPLPCGPMVTPLPRRRPWKVAREAVSLDRLSNGRLILGVGLGSPSDLEFERFGEPGDPKVRAAMLDESLDVLSGLWSGEPFKYQGVHYRLEETTFLPGPVQSPRIPIWVAGTWPRMAPLRRALKWDGYFPESTTPDDIRDVVEFVATNRASGGPFDIAFGNRRPMAEHARQLEEIAAYAEAGLTWWMQRLGPSYGSFQESRAHLRRGPPTV